MQCALLLIASRPFAADPAAHIHRRFFFQCLTHFRIIPSAVVVRIFSRVSSVWSAS